MSPRMTAWRPRRVMPVIVAALVLACGKESTLTGVTSPLAPDQDLRCDVPFAVVPGLERPSFYSERTSGIVDTPEEFCSLWDDVPINEPVPCDTTAVDFDREVVLVAGGTWYNTGGYGLEVTCVQTGTSPGSLEVLLALHAPGATCLLTQAFTNPLAIVKVPRPAESASFEILQREVYDCH